MLRIQEETLRHVLKALELIDTHSVYSALAGEIKAQGINDTIKQNLLSKYESATQKTWGEPVAEAVKWLKTIISDLEGGSHAL